LLNIVLILISGYHHAAVSREDNFLFQLLLQLKLNIRIGSNYGNTTLWIF